MSSDEVYVLGKVKNGFSEYAKPSQTCTIVKHASARACVCVCVRASVRACVRKYMYLCVGVGGGGDSTVHGKMLTHLDAYSCHFNFIPINVSGKTVQQTLY